MNPLIYIKTHLDSIVYHTVIGLLVTLTTFGVGLILFGLESWAKGYGFFGLF